MKEFNSLHPERLLAAYDVEIHGEEPIVTVEETERRITIHYTFPGFYLSDDERDVEEERIPFKQVTIAHTGFVGESGKPLLPSFGRYVQIPFNCNYNVTIKKGDPIQFDDVIVAPAQTKITDSEEDEEDEEDILEYDKKFYLEDQFYPDVVDVSGPFEIDGYNALLLHVRPLQYNPAKKKVRGYSTVTITIDVTPKDVYEYALTDPVLDREAYGNLFLNPKRRIEERVGTVKDEVRVTYFARRRGPEFLIIYHDTFKKAAETLKEWKNVRGLSTEIVSLTEVGTTVDDIKAYIRTERKSRSSRLRYVLLLGDVDMVPSEKVKGSLYGDINITDYYYSTQKDPKHEKQYVLPWISVGRIPVKTAEEALAVVEQIIIYEKNPPENPDYYRKMVFAAYFQDRKPRDGRADRGYMKTMEYIREHMVTQGFDVERVYTSNNPNMTEYHDGTPISEEVKNAVIRDKKAATKKLVSAASQGCLIIAHRDHGKATGWAHPPFQIQNLKDVTGETPVLFYSINCLTGRLDRRSRKDSFAEKLLKMKGGAPSLIAATRKSYPWLNDHLMKALFDAMWAGVLPTYGSTASYPLKYNRLGDVLNYAKIYLPTAMSGSDREIKDHLEIYHVIGDPTLELLKSNPVKMGMRVKVKQGTLDITLLSPCPKHGVITVWYEGELIKRIEPSSTHVRVSLRDTALWPVSSEKISVCFWAPGYRFQQVGVAE